jgi:hypothetical protein
MKMIDTTKIKIFKNMLEKISKKDMKKLLNLGLSIGKIKKNKKKVKTKKSNIIIIIIKCFQYKFLNTKSYINYVIYNDKVVNNKFYIM